MPTPKKGRRLGGSPAHQRLMLANLATSLFENGAITTTEAKARQLRPFAERLITKAKRGDLHNRRQVHSVIRDKSIVHVLFTEIGPKFADRPGGYTRITKIGPRKGDNAPMAVIELVEEQYRPKTRSGKPAAGPTAAEREPADEPAAVATGVDDAEGEAVQVEAQEAVAQQEPEGEVVEAPEDTAAADEEVEELPVEEPTGDEAVDQAAEEVAEEAAQEAADDQAAADDEESK